MLTFVVGTRPEVHKTIAVLEELHRRGIPFQIVTTNQHTTLLDELRTDPLFAETHHLGVPNFGDPIEFVATAEAKLLPWLRGEPGPIVVQGDTATALAGARAGHILGIPVCHIEAGIRTFDLTQPWPEEGFRQEITILASYHYAASEMNVEYLRQEDVPDGTIIRTGNPGLDRLGLLLGSLPTPRTAQPRCLVTLHRRESFEVSRSLGETETGRKMDHVQSGLERIVLGLLTACGDHPHTEFLWPVHPNPQVKAALPTREETPQNLILTQPLDHRDFTRLLATSRAVLTDSGGVQEEAAFLGIPAVIARQVSDRPESIYSGHALLAGYDPTKIRTSLKSALGFGLKATPFLGFGDGHAAPRIADHLTSLL